MTESLISASPLYFANWAILNDFFTFPPYPVKIYIFLMLGIVVYFWILIVFWVFKDSKARTGSVFFQFFSALLIIVLTPLLGLPLYWVMRPKHYLYDQLIWREAILSFFLECANCKTLNHLDHNACISCGESLKISCKECQKKYHYNYQYCPDCGAPNIE